MGNNVVFDGETDVETFLNAFGYEAVMFNWNETAQAMAIKYCLSGKALRYYNELDEDGKNDINAIF
jgi:hypothetical protein